MRLQWPKFEIRDDHGEVRYSTANTSKGCKPHRIVRRRISSEKRIQDYLAIYKRLALSAMQHTHHCLRVCSWIPRHFYTAFICQELPVVLNTAFRVRVQSLPSSSLVTQFFMKESNWSDTNKFSKIQLTNSILNHHNLFSISFSHWVDQAEVGFQVFLCFALLLEQMRTIYIGLARTAYGLPHAKIISSLLQL